MKIIVIILTLIFSNFLFAKTLPATNFQATQNFINKMVKDYDFDKNELLFIFSQVKLTTRDKTKKKKTKSVGGESITWSKYKDLFITEKHIQNGVKFWQDNIDTLEKAKNIYNIPVEIIVAILGIETNYGNKKGTFPTLETLAKYAFGNYKRRNFYKKELTQFLLMTRENSLPPLTITGSYAGAMGYPQFISSSYRHYAVDFNLDDRIDLFSDPIDAIGSIANYLNKHYWQTNGEIAREILLEKNNLKFAKISTNKPKKTAKHWRNNGINIEKDINNKVKIAFISLPQELINETWLTFWNFYVLTRYNHDNKYAMTTYQLSKKIKQQFNQTTKSL